MSAQAPIPSIGVVGVGSLGYHHTRILSTMTGARVSGVFDTDPARQAAAERDHGVTSRGSLEDLLDGSDAVVVAVPTHAHEEVAIAAVQRGVHVLIEKPIAPTLAAADRILAAAEESGAIVQIGHIERFNSAVMAAEPHLDHPLFVESHRMAPFVPRSTDVPVVLDLMIHDVDLVRSVVGESVSGISATGLPVLTESVDIANARLEFTGGAVANLTASRVSFERMRKLRIFQRSGYLSLNLAEGTGEFLRLKRDLPVFSGDPVWDESSGDALEGLVERIPLTGDGVEPLARELESFRRVVMGVAPPVVDGPQGRAALELSLSIQDRIRSHVVDTRSA